MPLTYARRSVLSIGLLIVAIALTGGSPASAQMGAGGVGGEAGGGVGGTRGGGSKTEKKARPKRNEQPAVEPTVSRDKLQKALEAALMRGTASTPYLMNLFEQASTQVVPASLQSRKALADALSADLKGKKLEADNAAAIAEPITVAINADGVAPEELDAKKDPLKAALETAGVGDEHLQAVLAAFDAAVVDQHDEAIRKVADDLENVQKEGTAGDDVRSSLATSLAALADESSKPSEEHIEKLAADLTKAVDAAQLTNREKAQLAFDLRSIFNNPAATPAEFFATLNGVRNLLKAGLAKQVDIQLVAADLQAIHKSRAGTGGSSDR